MSPRVTRAHGQRSFVASVSGQLHSIPDTRAWGQTARSARRPWPRPQPRVEHAGTGRQRDMAIEAGKGVARRRKHGRVAPGGDGVGQRQRGQRQQPGPGGQNAADAGGEQRHGKAARDDHAAPERGHEQRGRRGDRRSGDDRQHRSERRRAQQREHRRPARRPRQQRGQRPAQRGHAQRDRAPEEGGRWHASSVPKSALSHPSEKSPKPGRLAAAQQTAPLGSRGSTKKKAILLGIALESNRGCARRRQARKTDDR